MSPLEKITKDFVEGARKDTHSEIFTILKHCTDVDIQRLIDAGVDNKFIELDFIKSRLVYFGILKQNPGDSFGIALDMIPDVVAKWRDEKINILK